MERWKRSISMLLCIVMLLGILPVNAFASEAVETNVAGESTKVVASAVVDQDKKLGDGVEAQAEGTPIDAAIIFSDLHTNKSAYKESTVKGIMTAFKNTGLPFSSVTSGGDAFSVNEDNSSSNGPYTGLTKTLNEYIHSVFADIPVNYVWSDHDRYAVLEDGKTLLDKTSRIVYGAGSDGKLGTSDDGNYYVYALSMGDLCSYDRYSAGFNYTASNNSNRVSKGFTETVAKAIENFKADAAKLNKDRPLLIVSHQPLFDNRNDNAWAEDWFDAINKVAEEMDVAFFYGHNHKYDLASDYYYAKGSKLPVATADNWGWNYETGVGYKPSVNLSSESKTLNFTHMCAGYLAPSSTGSTSGTTREGTAVAVTIYDDKITYTTYNASGVYSGDYALNETVTREHAAPVEKTYFSEDSFAAVTATATGATLTAVIEDEKADELLSFWYGYDIQLEGQVEGTSVTVKLWLDPDTMTSDDLAVYHLDASGEYAPVAYEVKNDETGLAYVEITNAALGTYVYGTPATPEIPEGAVLHSSLTVTSPKQVYYFDTDATWNEDLGEYVIYLDITGMEVLANYVYEGTIYSKEIEWDRFGEIEGGYSLTFTGLEPGNYGTKTVKVTYGEASAIFPVYVCPEDLSVDDVNVHFTVPGTLSVMVQTKEASNEVAEAVASHLKGNLVVYDIAGQYATGVEKLPGETHVTLPIPEGIVNPLVCYVSADGKEMEVMPTTNNGDNTLTFVTSHFSNFVVGESTDIEVPNPITVTVDGPTTTTVGTTNATEIISGTRYVLYNVRANNHYLSDDKVNGADRLQTKEEIDNYWYITVEGDNYYIQADNAMGKYLSVSVNKAEMVNNKTALHVITPDKNTERPGYWAIYRVNGGQTAYLNNYWGATTPQIHGFTGNDEGSRWYLYPVTEASGKITYSIAATNPRIETVVVEGKTLTLGSTLTNKPTTGAATTTDTTTSATYAVYKNGTVNGDPNNVIEKIEGNTVTFTGNTGKALVQISYTSTFGTVTNYIEIIANGPTYTVTISEGETVVSGTTVTVKGITEAVYEKNEDGTVEITNLEKLTVKDLTTAVTFDTGAGAQTPTLNDKRYIEWEIPAEYEQYAMLDNGKVTFLKEGAFYITANLVEEAEDGTKTIKAQAGVNFSATVDNYYTPIGNTNDFPDYPNKGSVNHDKTATAVGNFSQTGMVQMELSMTGVPYTNGVDVIVMLDMSTSMKRYTCTGTTSKCSNDGKNGHSCETRLEELNRAMGVLQNSLGSSPISDKIRVAVADFNRVRSDAPYNLDGTNDRTKDAAALAAGNSNNVYTGSEALNAGAFISAADFKNLTFILTNDDTVSGTNYDYGFDAVYQLGHAIQVANGAEQRPLYVLFMSDGAANQFNYYGTQGGSSPTAGSYLWNYWLTGTINGQQNAVTSLNSSGEPDDWGTINFSNVLYTTTHSYYYDSVDHDGDGIVNEHRMANAIKGSKDERFEVIRKGTNNLTDVIQSGDKDNLYTLPGLGATMYSIAFYVADDGAIQEESGKHALHQIATSDDYYIEAETPGALEEAFGIIGGKIAEAATDIAVTDKVSDDFTMVFGIPTGYSEQVNENVAAALADQEFYIDVVNYHLDINDHERQQDANGNDVYDTLLRLYLKDSNGNEPGGIYSAAKDNNGTAADEPVFTAKPADKKGYWSIVDDSYVREQYDLVINVDGTNWKFMERGDGTHNMTSGAYAYGEIDTYNNLAEELVIVTPLFAYDAKSHMLAWTTDKLSETEEIALRYFLYLNNSAAEVGNDKLEAEAKSYYTNDFAYMTYKNHLDHDCKLTFPVPQVTWNGAQVSYVFYLVNAYGQPINRSGQVVDFANATFVTEKFTDSIVWNQEGDTSHGTGQLSANWLASNLLPEDYKVYDPEAQYLLNVYAKADGTTIRNEFTVRGAFADNIVDYLTASDSDTPPIVHGVELNESNVSLTTTKVYNTQAGQKVTLIADNGHLDTEGKKYSTTYYASDLPNIDFANTTVAFAVVWQPALTPDTVVVDFGLDVLIDVTKNDFMLNTVSGISAARPSASYVMNTGISTYASMVNKPLTIDGNVISVEGENQIRFHQTDMLFDDPVVFYYETPVDFTENSTERSGFMYSSVTVIPATTIYYEDEFVTLKTFDRSNNEIVDEQGNQQGWTKASVKESALQAQDRPGPSQISKDLDADNVYGYDKAYENSSTYSLSGSAMVNVNADQYATAEFDFYGTGFDIISLTSNKTGTITTEVFKISANGEVDYSNPEKDFIVDTYYGYARELVNVTYFFMQDKNSETGEYIIDATTGLPQGTWHKNFGSVVTEPGMVPTEADLSVTKDTKDGASRTGMEYRWTHVDTNSPNDLYQVPVMKVFGLTYGKYRVRIIADYNSFFDHEQYDDQSYDFYLDAIRIYDPAGRTDAEMGDTVKDAYEKDGELYPEYYEPRNWLIGQEKFDSLDSNAVTGVVFIDGTGVGAGNTASVQDYKNFGPNNEVYLAKNQSIAFALNAVATNANYDPKVQIAWKSVGGNAKVKVSYMGNNGLVTAFTKEINTATDLYYDITGLNGKTIVIESVGEAILSITNVKISNHLKAEAAVATSSSSSSSEAVAVEEAAYAPFTVRKADIDQVLEYMNAEPVEEPEETVPETTVPEETEPQKPDFETVKKELQDAVTAAKALEEKNYTKESFKVLKDAKKDAEKVLKDKKATQADLEAALDALNAAMEALEAKPEKAEPTKPTKPEKEKKPGKPVKEEPEKADKKNGK